MNKKIFLSLVALLFIGCSTAFDSQGVYHTVRNGENLLWIAKSYGVELQDLAELNNIQNTQEKLTAGDRLYIPSKRYNRHKNLPFERHIAQHIEKEKPTRTSLRGKKIKEQDKEKVYTEHTRFIWPIGGAVVSPFGLRHGRRHDGIDIHGDKGDPIKAADNGKVVFAGTMRGYGNLLLVRHEGNFFTAYAHTQTNLVKEGANVRKGQIIAKVGRTGRATGPHLHFEVREGEKARNPLFFLPVRDKSLLQDTKQSEEE